jgi:hypothetical protein
VAVFTNRTGDPQLDHFGSLAGSWLAGALEASGAVVVVGSSDGAAAPVARGRPTGSSTAGPVPPDLRLWGSYYRAGSAGAGGALLLQGMVTDVRSRAVVFAAEPVRTDPEDPGAGLQEFLAQLVRALTAKP